MSLGEIFEKFSLDSVVLFEASVKRGDGDLGAIRDVENRGRFESIDVSDEGVQFRVGVTSEVVDSDETVALSVDAVYMASYSVEAGYEPTEDDLQNFLMQGVVFQLHPYFREFISSVTGKAGIPPIFLPVLVRDESAALGGD